MKRSMIPAWAVLKNIYRVSVLKHYELTSRGEGEKAKRVIRSEPSTGWTDEPLALCDGRWSRDYIDSDQPRRE